MINLPPLIDIPWKTVTASAPHAVEETDTGTVTKAQRVAKSKLKKKNRKGKKHRITLPLNLRIEAGDVYTLHGFSPDFDGNWLVVHCEHKFAGEAGSNTTLELELCITGY